MLIINGLDRVMDGTLELDCPSMTWSEAGETLTGGGYIRQLSEGGFEFALFSTTPGDDSAWFRRQMAAARTPAGTLLPPDSGGELRATDVAGQDWAAIGLKPRRTVSRHQTLKGTARELQTVESAPKGAGCLVEVRIPGRLRFPPNQPSQETTSVGGKLVRTSAGPKAAAVDLADAKLRVREVTGGTSFVAVSERPLRADTELRIVDAISFLESAPVPWSALSRWQEDRATFRVRGGSYRPQSQFALPPLPEDETDAYWRLFACLADGPDEMDSSLRLWIGVTATAAMWPLESRALLTAIAVEAMAKQLLPAFEPGLAGYSEADEDRARQLLEGSALPERLTQKLLGLLQGRGASASDRLFELVRVDVATEEQVKAWKILRHSIAHGALPQMGQELVNRVHQVRTLFSRLVFAMVGYAGPYLDYGSVGWPVRQHSSAEFRAGGV